MGPFQSLFLCLIIATGSCANPASPDRPVSGGTGDSTARQQTEGVAGRIIDEDGSAVEGASVLAAPLDPGGPAVPEIAIVSDAMGRYQWPLRAGRYAITVVADGYQRGSKEVAVKAAEITTLDFVLSRNRRTHALR
jgi:Carboxypeptidase regulatory-like domain